ncbi:MAG: hypothetical protein ACM3H8_04420 [Sphingobacteriales bacterium]
MKMLITENIYIRDIKLEFSKLFPFLKIEFFRNGFGFNKHYSPEKRLSDNYKIGDAWKRKVADEVEINDTTKVKDLEMTFMEKFGLAVQIFRKSGNLWLETTMTDNWTLKQQNDHGKEISTEKSDTKKDNLDFDLNRDQL